MAGYKVVSIASAPDGGVDLEALKAACGEDTAGLMLTNPNTVGLFDKNILKLQKSYMNAAVFAITMEQTECSYGTVRPGDMGFDVIHLNLA